MGTTSDPDQKSSNAYHVPKECFSSPIYAVYIATCNLNEYFMTSNHSLLTDCMFSQH